MLVAHQNSMMHIRKARPDDADALAGIARVLGQDLSAAGFSADIDAYADGFYVAEVDGSIAGYLVMRVGDAPACRGASPVQLWRLFVLPAHHGRGVAAALMARAHEHARADGHGVIWLGTGHDNVRALAFYRKAGFDAVGTARLHHGADSHEDAILSCVVDGHDMAGTARPRRRPGQEGRR